MGMGAEVAEAAGEAAKMRAGLPASAAAWLAGMHDAERDALRPDTHDDADDEVRLTASAHALGLEPGANLEQSDVHARYVALAQQLHACREVGEAKTEALQRLHSAGAFLQAYLKGKKGVRAPHRLPPLTPQGVARERLPQPPRAPQTASLLGHYSPRLALRANAPRLALRANATGWRHSGQLGCSPVSTESVRIPWKPSSRTQCMPAWDRRRML